ncbi:MAG TPA: helix-turn-helix domain-containing protein [Candidatus Gallimonas intestinavium]|uniref:Helix-turn-helix domain-containing protein n=1 Tax=Candidatus Gallimonas intestinavium TaxID=2838603 RepID=A0A9D2G5F8_9FIRM|nr:helix-turn-helix domain-containing protein [Candidatus Gallimonas intestinavium]
MNYGESLRYQRVSNGKSLLDVEKDTGISNANLSRWECGKVLPNIDFCVRLADYYGVSLDELVGRDFIGQSTISVRPENQSK